MRAYVVREGDYLTRIAHRFGLLPKDIWDDPKNAELKKLRKNPEVLQPGDVLRIPDAPTPALDISPGETLSVTATVPTVTLELSLGRDDIDAPGTNSLAGLAYEAFTGHEVLTGTVGGDGLVKLEVPIDVHEVRVVVEEAGVACLVRVGTMDPETERTGWHKRLSNLGFLDQAIPDESFDLAPALRAYQRAKKLPITGLADEATRKALFDEHGS